MVNLKISRRNFMGTLLASGAALPFSKYPWADPSESALAPEKKIDWGRLHVKKTWGAPLKAFNGVENMSVKISY